MLNPDGVVMGNYRTGFGGRDLNRQFRNCDKVNFHVFIKENVSDSVRADKSCFCSSE